jgi:hypothetical protein
MKTTKFLIPAARLGIAKRDTAVTGKTMTRMKASIATIPIVQVKMFGALQALVNHVYIHTNAIRSANWGLA